MFTAAQLIESSGRLTLDKALTGDGAIHIVLYKRFLYHPFVWCPVAQAN